MVWMKSISNTMQWKVAALLLLAVIETCVFAEIKVELDSSSKIIAAPSENKTDEITDSSTQLPDREEKIADSKRGIQLVIGDGSSTGPPISIYRPPHTYTTTRNPNHHHHSPPQTFPTYRPTIPTARPPWTYPFPPYHGYPYNSGFPNNPYYPNYPHYPYYQSYPNYPYYPGYPPYFPHKEYFGLEGQPGQYPLGGAVDEISELGNGIPRTNLNSRAAAVLAEVPNVRLDAATIAKSPSSHKYF